MIIIELYLIIGICIEVLLLACKTMSTEKSSKSFIAEIKGMISTILAWPLLLWAVYQVFKLFQEGYTDVDEAIEIVMSRFRKK